MEQILNNIYDSVTNKLGRKYVVTRQDLHNKRTQFNIDGITRHKNDLTSVMSWVEEITLNYNPVLPQGVMTFCLFYRRSFNVTCLKVSVLMQCALTLHMVRNADDFNLSCNR